MSVKLIIRLVRVSIEFKVLNLILYYPVLDKIDAYSYKICTEK